jgi:hypothetical protein
MGSEMQPQIMRAQKSEQIFIFEIMKTLDMFSNIKAFGLIHVHMKFNCGNATHFFLSLFFKKMQNFLHFEVSDECQSF